MLEKLLFGIVVIITHFIEGVTGFGCTVLALPFATAISGIRVAVPVLTIIAWITALYIVIIDFKKVNFKELLKIYMFVLPGMPIGMWIFSNTPDFYLKILLGLFMIVLAIKGIIETRKKDKTGDNDEGGQKDRKSFLVNFFLILGGIIHGAFSSGGPFIVVYATRALRDKCQFRATLCMLWLTLNTVKIAADIAMNKYTPEIINLTLFVLPFLAAGIVLGNFAHRKIKERAFLTTVYLVILISGAFMLYDVIKM